MKKLYLGEINRTSEIRCPHLRPDGRQCNKKHATGQYPDEPLEIKCTRCGKLFIVQRLPSSKVGK